MSGRDASLGHDLRSPLNHILGYSEIAIEDAEAAHLDGIAQDLRRIHDAGKRLLAVLESALAAEQASIAGITPDAVDREIREPINQIIGYADLLEEEAADRHLDGLAADIGKIRRSAGSLLTTVTHRLTAAPDHAPSPATVRDVVLPATVPGMILVVDDSDANREVLSRRLERLGHTVAVAGDGREALEAVASRRFDLMLLDIRMPVMDGFEVLKRLKADPVHRALPVVVLSASDDPDVVLRCISLGADDHLRKPCDPLFLRTRIDACLEKKRLRDREQSYLDLIEAQKKRSDELLHVILPPDVAAELKAASAVRPRRYEDVGVLFCDIVGFTAFSDQTSPETLLVHLQALVERQEEAASRHGLEKIKTIGDAFMAAAGLGTSGNQALACVACGLEMAAAAATTPPHWQVRVGIHCGPVVAGVVGRHKYQYDIWGDTVNTASRVEHHALSGSVCVTRSTWDRIAGDCEGRSIGTIDIKGKGPTEIIQVLRLTNAPSLPA